MIELKNNHFIEFNKFDENDLKYKKMLMSDEEDTDITIYLKDKYSNGNIYLKIKTYDEFFCIINETKKNNKDKDKKIFKIIYLKLYETLSDIKLISTNAIALTVYNGVIILSISYPYSVIKFIGYPENNNPIFKEYNSSYIKVFTLSYNPNIFIILNNGIFLMQIFNKQNYQLISNIRGIFGNEILEINSKLILLTYYSSNNYLMLVVDIKKFKILDCINHSLLPEYYHEKFIALKNKNFYLYPNQIEYLAINYPKFKEKNYFIKNDVQIIKFEYMIRHVYLLNNDILGFISLDEGLIIEDKNYSIPNVTKISLTDKNNIIITLNDEFENRTLIEKLKVIKLNENNYEILYTINMSISNIIKINNNRFITHDLGKNEIKLWILNEENSLKYLSKKLLSEYNYNNSLQSIFLLNEEENIIIPNYNNGHLDFWKINEDNTINKIFDTNLNYNIQLLFKYDNILIVYTLNLIFFIDINTFQLIKEIRSPNYEICCMTKTLNGNILFGEKRKEGYDIIEYKFNKTNCDLIKSKILTNIQTGEISQIIIMKNGNIFTYEKDNNFIFIF